MKIQSEQSERIPKELFLTFRSSPQQTAGNFKFIRCIRGFTIFIVFLSSISLFFYKDTQFLWGMENQKALSKKSILRLSLEEGKLMVLKKNLDITIQRITPRIEDARIDKEKGVFDPSISGSLKLGGSTTPFSTRSSVAAGGRSISESEAYTINTGISGKSHQGAEYSFEFNNTRTKDTFNQFQSEYDAFGGITVTQPLLKDFGRDVSSFNIHIAQKNRAISISDLEQRVIDTITEFKNAYWDLVLAIEDLKVKQESLRLAESLLDLNRKKLRAEVIAPLEVTQAEAGVASRKEDVIIAQRIVKERENTLKRLLSDDVHTMKGVEILPVDVPQVVQVSPDHDEMAIQEALMSRPDYQKAKVEIEKKQITIKYAENQRFPRIDLEASYGLNGLGDSFRDSLEDMEGKPEWQLGVVLKLPLGNRSAKGDLRIARLEANQALLNLKRLEQEIVVEVENAIKEIEANKERIEATKVSTRLAKESLRAEELKLKEGLSTSHNLLQFQEKLEEAKSREITALIDYNKSIVEFSRIKGTILKEEGINLSENAVNGLRR